MRRFIREIAALKQLNHPNILKVLFAGQHQGIPYYVSPLLRGGNLNDRLVREGLFDTQATVAWAAPIASALDAMHEQGMVHRDVKPSNILFDTDGEAHLADFGVLHLEDADSAQGGTTAPVGTPAYMAPEQIEGDHAVSARSDQYALAVTICVALTGRTPFEGETAEEVLREKVLGPPRALAGLSLPLEVRRALRRATKADPARRFPSCAALVEALSLNDRASRQASRRPPAMRVALLGVSALLIIAATAWLLVRSSDDRTRTSTPSEAPHQGPERATRTVPPVSPPERQTIFGAIRDGDFEAVRRLLRSGVDPNSKDDRGLSVLHHVALHGRHELVASLVGAGASIDTTAEKYVRRGVELGWCTPLHLAASQGRARVASELVRNGAHPGLLVVVRDLRKSTDAPIQLDPLRLALGVPEPGARRATFEAIHGPGPRFLRTDALLACAKRGAWWAVPQLLEHGADPNGGLAEDIALTDRHPDPPLWTAVLAGDVASVFALLRAGASAAHRRRAWYRGGGEGVLFLAAGNRRVAKQDPKAYLEILKTLVARCDPNDVKSGHWHAVPLGNAATHSECDPGVDLLLAHKADPTLALPLAAKAGRKEVVARFLDLGADASKAPAVEWAARAGQIDVVRYLVARGADVDRRDPDQRYTALSEAVYQPRVVTVLLELGANPQLKDWNGYTAIGRAAWSAIESDAALRSCRLMVDSICVDPFVVGHHPSRRVRKARESPQYRADADVRRRVDALLELLDASPWERTLRVPAEESVARAVALGDVAGVRRALRDAPPEASAWRRGRSSLLHLAAGRGHLSIVKLLLESRGEEEAEGNSKTVGWPTPLMFAAARGHVQVVEHLVAQGRDHRKRYRGGSSALDFAAENGRLRAVQKLIAIGADVDAKPQEASLPPLWRAALGGHLEVARTLLEAGAGVGGETESGRTIVACAVMGSAAERRAPMLRLIYGAGTPPISSKPGSLHPAAMATRNHDAESLAVLGANGFDLEGQLSGAAWRGDTQAIQALLEAGADPTRSYAMHQAARRGDMDCVKILLRTGMSIDHRDEPDGHTPLMRAARDADLFETSDLESLLGLGADMRLLDKLGRSAMHHAAEGWSPSGVRFLAARGMSVLEKTSADQTPRDLAQDRLRGLAKRDTDEGKRARACIELLEKLEKEERARK